MLTNELCAQITERLSISEKLYSNYMATCVINALLCVVATGTNAVIITAIVKTRALHKPSYVFICTLAISDLCVGAGRSAPIHRIPCRRNCWLSRTSLQPWYCLQLFRPSNGGFVVLHGHCNKHRQTPRRDPATRVPNHGDHATNNGNRITVLRFVARGRIHDFQNSRVLRHCVFRRFHIHGHYVIHVLPHL